MAQRSQSKAKGWQQPVLLLLRLLIVGAALGVITGTALKWLAPQLNTDVPLPPPVDTPPKPAASLGSFNPQRENQALSRRLAEIAATQKDLKVGAFVLVLDDGTFAQLHPDRPLSAASSIKTPILLVAFEALDQAKLSLNGALKLNKAVVGGGAGWMGSQPLGSQFSVFEVATEMIRVSDNTATNLLIQRLGGKDSLNSRFLELGLEGTVINNLSLIHI